MNRVAILSFIRCLLSDEAQRRNSVVLWSQRGTVTPHGSARGPHDKCECRRPDVLFGEPQGTDPKTP
jgi:hypothetical protein